MFQRRSELLNRPTAIWKKGKSSVGVEVVEGHGKGSGYAFEAEDFGKSVFLTREEAEAALKEREG